jgi:hypothetical protein
MSLTRWIHGGARTSVHVVTATSFRPEVEALEQRQTPSRGISGGMVGEGVYALFQDGSVWSYPYPSQGTFGGTNLTTLSTSPAQQVSAGWTYGTWTDESKPPPQPVVALAYSAPFVRFADGSVWEYANVNLNPFNPTPQYQWVEVCSSGARQINASKVSPQSYTPTAAAAVYNTVYILFNDSSVWQHTGLDPSAGWTEITTGARGVSAGEDATGNPAAFVRYQGGSVWEYSPLNPSATWTLIADSGATHIQASPTIADTVFASFADGSLWEYTGSGAAPGWHLVQNGGVAGLSLGTASATEVAAFVLESDGSVWEHIGTDPNAGWTEVTGGGATAVYASQAHNTVFVNFGGALWEDIIQDWNAGWYLVADSGVAY